MRNTLFLLLTSVLLVGCNNHSYTPISTYQPQSHTSNIYSAGINWAKAKFYMLPDDAQKMQVDCVNWALTDMQAGQTCRWDYGNSAGIVKLVNVQANGCQTLYNSVLHKGKTRNWQETACYNHNSGTWRIY